MIELKNYQCEHCNTIYNEKNTAAKCEGNHIIHSELQIVRAIHKECHPIIPEEGQWPSFIVVGKNELRDKLVRYAFECEEDISGVRFMSDPYYEINLIERGTT